MHPQFRNNIMQYSQICKRLPFFHFIYQLAPISSRQGMFFIYTCVVSYKFALASLRKSCNFFPWLLVGNPLLLFLSQPQSTGCFTLRQMTIRLILVHSFTNFMIPLNATRHSRDLLTFITEIQMPVTLTFSKVIFL